MVHPEQSGREGGLYPRLAAVRVASVEAVAQVDRGLCRREGYAAGDYVVEAAD